MNDITDKKSCYNCKYFFRHYYWRHSALKETFFGHCSEHRYKSFYRMFPPENGCNLWEPDTEKTEYENKNIADALTEMAKRVNNIASYLNAEKPKDGELF